MSQSDLHSQVLHPGKQIGTSAVCLNKKEFQIPTVDRADQVITRQNGFFYFFQKL